MANKNIKDISLHKFFLQSFHKLKVCPSNEYFSLNLRHLSSNEDKKRQKFIHPIS